jgi:type I restriction enzyme, S subunit
VSLPRYGEYRDTGIEWLGEVPAHWTIPRLRDVSRFSGGGTPARDEPSYWNGDIPWVSAKDMKSEYIHDTEEHITSAGLAGSSAQIVPPGQLLMVVRSGILKHTIPVSVNLVSLAVNQDVKVLQSAPEVCDSRFLMRWVQGFNAPLLLEWSKQGATVESIEHEYLSRTVLPLPPLPEQTAIASFLDRETAKIDALIAEQERLIALLQEKRQAVISHAVTKGLDPNVPMKDSGVEWIGEVPDNWSIVRFRYIFQESSEKIEYEVVGPMLSVSGYRGIEVKDYDDENRRRRDEDLIGYRIVRPGQLVVNTMWLNYAGLGVSAHEGHVSPAYRAYWIDSRTEARFAHWLLRSPIYVQGYTRLLTGIRPNSLQMSRDDMMDFPVLLPPISEQKRISDFLDRTDSHTEILILEQERLIALSRERRRSLITAAVTGQIDVRGLVEPAA